MSRMKNLYVFFLCIYLFSLPLGAMSIGAIGSALKLLAIFPVLLAIFEFKNYKPTSPIKIYFLYILICGFSVLYALNVTAAWGKFSSLVLLFLLLASTGSFNYSNEDINRIKNGIDIPNPIAKKLHIIFILLAVKEKVATVPIIGIEHGVANKTINIAVIKLSKKIPIFRFFDFSYFFCK